MNPNAPMLRGRMVRIAVEGFINGTFISGVLIERMMPVQETLIYLPILMTPY